MAITDLQVTYGSALGAPKFHRVVTKTHTSADINKGKGTQVYLWYIKGTGDPIVDVRVLHDDEPAPEGFQKLKQDLTKGVDSRAYIAYRRAPETEELPAIMSITIAYNDDAPDDGFERCDRPLNRDEADPSWLFYRRRSAEDGAPDPDKWSPTKLVVGDWFDCQDTYNKWCVAQVLSITDTHIRVRYRDWGPKWDEDIPKTSSRLGELGTHGDISAPKRVQQGESWDDLDSKQVDSVDSRITQLLAGEMEEEEFNSFFKKDLPDFAEKLMRSSYTDAAIPPMVNGLLQRMHEVVATYLKKPGRMPLHIEQMYGRLFLSDPKCSHFFEYYGACRQDSEEGIAASGKYATIPPSGASAYFVANMNHFGVLGGYDAVLARLERRDPPVEVSEMLTLLDALAVCRYCYNREDFGVEYFTKVHEALMWRVSHLSEAEIKGMAEKASDAILTSVARIYNTVLKEAGGSEMADRVSLEFSNRLIRCDILNKRLSGEKAILEKLTSMLDTESNDGHHGAARGGRAGGAITGHWLTSEVFAKWLVDHRVVHILLGGADEDGRSYDTHVEIVNRLPEILKFLGRQGAVTEADLELLWKSAAGQSDTFRRSVYDVIAPLVKTLSVELLDMLFDRHISKIPVEDLDEVSFRLLLQFTGGAVLRSVRAGKGRSYGVSTLWDLIQDDSGTTDAHVLDMAQSHLVELLQLPQCKKLGEETLFKCMDNLARGTSVPQSLSVAQALIEAMPAYGGAAAGAAASAMPDTRQDMLNLLEEKFEVLSLLLADVARYCDAAREVARKRELTPEAVEADASTKLVGRYTHAEQVSRRLAFLRFHLADSEAELTMDQLNELWRALAADPVSRADKETLLGWLSLTKFGDANSRSAAVRAATHLVPFDDEVVARVFSEIMCNDDMMNFATLGQKGYGAFETFFRHDNGTARKIERHNSPHFMVNDTELNGIDSLWAIALTCGTPEVARSALEFLVSLHVRVSFSADAKAVWGGFVSACMGRIKEAHAGAVAEGASDSRRAELEATINRVMRVLTHFLGEVESRGSGAGAPVTVEVTVRARGEQPQVVKRTLPGSTTMGQLRDLVAKEVNHPASQLRIFGLDKHIYNAAMDDEIRLGEGQVGAQLNGYKCPKVETDTAGHVPAPPIVDEEMEDERRHPREILSNNQEHFELLFALLRAQDQGIIDSAWALLQLLPTNEKIRNDISTLRGAVEAATPTAVPWTELLDGRAVLRLLYSLQIVDHIVQPGQNMTDTESETQKAWCDKFVALGGFTHLHSVLMDMDLPSMVEQALTKQCLQLLLKLVNFFMVVPEQYSHLQSTKEFATDLDFGAMATRLLSVLQLTCASNPGPDPKGVEEAALPALNPTTSPADTKMGGDAENKTDKDGDGAEAGPGAESKEEAKEEAVTMTIEAEVVHYALNILNAIVLQRRETLGTVYRFPDVSGTFLFALMHSGDPAVREETAKGAFQLCTKFRSGADSDSKEAGGPKAGGADADAVPTPSEFFLPMLLEEIPQMYKYADRLDQYVGLLRKLIKDSGGASLVTAGGPGGPEDAGLGVDARALVTRLAKMITEHPVVETNEDEQDFVLRALLQTTAAVLKRCPELKLLAGGNGAGQGNLVEHVFEEGLFASPSAESRGRAAPPKCKHPRTRKHAFALLAELAKGCEENNEQLCMRVTPHHSAPKKKAVKKKRTIWDFMSRSETKSSTGYVGLKNLGCICYMNASNQQFFMVPEFRKGMLQFDDQEEDKTESMMFQMQKMFAYLQESEKQYYNPKGYCHAFKDYGGEPTNVLVQKDASEYLGMLFQQIETKTMGTEQEKLLKQVFGGTLCNELIAKGRYSEREEPFQFISVDVKNRRNLDEGLKQFISGEQVEYRWEDADGNKESLDTTKRASIKQLPPHLIIHLKRFEFDYNTLRQVKLNDAFEFPMDLDMRPYTKEGRPDKAAAPAAEGDKDKAKEEGTEGEAGDDERKATTDEPSHPPEYYQYELMGMVVHTGTADSGHYYSFIRERDYESTAAGGDDTRRWLCFNDQWVSVWDVNDIERECFGGEETYRVGAYTSYVGGVATRQQGYTARTTRHRNAFVLFYDRVRPRLRLPAEGAAAATDSTVSSSVSIGGGIRAGVLASKMLARHRARKAMLQNRGRVPPSIFEAIWAENLEHWHRKNVFDKNYFEFIRQLVTATSCPPVEEYPAEGLPDEAAAVAAGGSGMGVIKLATNFILRTLSQSKEKESLPQWNEKLKALLAKNKVACVWLLQTLIADVPKLREFLLEVEEDDTRTSIADILSFVLQQLAPHERAAYPAADEPRLVTRAAAAAASGSGTASDSKGYEAASSDSKGPDPARARAPSEGKLDEVEAATTVTPFLAPPGKTVAAFVETMLDMLPDAADNWRQFSQFFSVLRSFAALGEAECTFLNTRGAITLLVDFMLGPDSPKAKLENPEPEGAEGDKAKEKDGDKSEDPPEGDGAAATADAGTGPDSPPRGHHPPLMGPHLPSVVTGNVGSGGQRRHMGDAMTKPNFEPIFELLGSLAFCCLPPSGAEDSPFQAPPRATLGDLDRAMLTCDAMFVRILRELERFKRVKQFRPLVSHLVWNHEPVLELLTRLLGEGVKDARHDELKPYFRAVSLLINVEDAMQEKRVDALLSAVVGQMKAQSVFFMATETAIALMVRLCMHNPAAAAWATKNAESVAWMEEWLSTNAVAPPHTYGAPPRPGEVTLYKPGRYAQSGIAHSRSSNLIANVQRMLEGGEFIKDGYDSDDDPMSLVGTRITVKWARNNWYQGMVDRYNKENGMHLVTYDDGEKKWYRMSDKTFRIVSTEPAAPEGEAPPGGDGAAGTGEAGGATDPPDDGNNQAPAPEA